MNKKKIYSAKCLRNNVVLKREVPNEYGVYKWWCKKEILIKILQRLDLNYKDCIKDIEIKKDYRINCVDNKSKRIRGALYCIYVGETSNLHKRILGNHIGGNIDTSTFRYTVASILVGKENEEKINSIIDDFFVEWEEYDEKVYHEIQYKYINRYFRPLNNDDICPNNDKYKDDRHYKLTKKAKSRYSSKIRELRKKLK